MAVFEYSSRVSLVLPVLMLAACASSSIDDRPLQPFGSWSGHCIDVFEERVGAAFAGRNFPPTKVALIDAILDSLPAEETLAVRMAADEAAKNLGHLPNSRDVASLTELVTPAFQDAFAKHDVCDSPYPQVTSDFFINQINVSLIEKEIETDKVFALDGVPVVGHEAQVQIMVWFVIRMSVRDR